MLQNILGYTYIRKCWAVKFVKKKGNLNLIKIQEIHISNEWCDGKITAVAVNVNKQQVSLREKIAKHKGTQVHIKMENVLEKSKFEVMPNQIVKLSNIDLESTKENF